MIKFPNHLSLADFMSFETANKTFQQKLNNWTGPPSLAVRYQIKNKS